MFSWLPTMTIVCRFGGTLLTNTINTKMMKNLKIVFPILAACFLFACTGDAKSDKTINSEKTDTAIKEKSNIDLMPSKIDSSIIDSLSQKPVVFNPKLSFNETPLTFTFTYKNKKYRFYACAYYLLPNKTAKAKDIKQLEILASIYDGLGGDDFNDGADLKIEVPLKENNPLKIASGYFSVDKYKILDIVDGYITITKSNKNIISGTFTINGKIEDKETGKPIEKFKITDGKFKKLPVTVHYIADFEEGWINPNI